MIKGKNVNRMKKWVKTKPKNVEYFNVSELNIYIKNVVQRMSIILYIYTC